MNEGSTPRVSVLMDTHIHGRFIERAITSVLEQGMAWWKFLGNRSLTKIENYRAYCRRVLEEVPFSLNSGKFVFDEEFLVQAARRGFGVMNYSEIQLLG